jgi:hypothetical protein
MNKMVVDCTTNEVEITPLTNAEIKAYEKKQLQNQSILDAEQAETEAKVAARETILNRLGLSAEEAAILLG